MLLSHKPACAYIGIFEMEGLLSVLDRRIEELGEDGDVATRFYAGAFAAISLLLYTNRIDTQADFMPLLDRLYQELEGERGDDDVRDYTR